VDIVLSQIGEVKDPIAYDGVVLYYLPQFTLLVCCGLLVIALLFGRKRVGAWDFYSRCMLLTVAIALLTDLCALTWRVRSLCLACTHMRLTPQESAEFVFNIFSANLWDFGRLCPVIAFGLICWFVLSILGERGRRKGPST
jgi:hypothetical protein